MLNHYKAMIPHCSHLLIPLTALTKKNINLNGQRNINKPLTYSKIPLLTKFSLPTQTSWFPLKSTPMPQIPNWIHHYSKGQATCILFQETHQSSNEIHCDRTQTACDSGNTLWV
jgi:hypothetical protein